MIGDSHFTYPMIAAFILPWSLKQWAKSNYSTRNKYNNYMNTNEITSNTCNALLRGELSAIETYTQAITKFGTSEGEGPLEGIRADHLASAESLRKLVGEYGEEASTSSGAWGTFATSVEGAATLLGKSPALLVLQQGEEHGISQYEEALRDEQLNEDVKNLIRNTLLPAQREHLVALERCKMNAA